MKRAGENATIAKIRAMHGRMLSAEDYKTLSAKKSISEVAQFLKEHSRLAGALDDIDVNTVHRDFLEEALRKQNFETFIRLRDFQNLGAGSFYNFVCERYELDQLASLVLSVRNGERYGFVKSLPSYFLPQSELDFLALSKCTEISELCSELKKTKYASLADGIMSLSGSSPDGLAADMLFQRYHNDRLLKSIKDELPKKAAEVLAGAVKKDIDLRNTVIAYRLKTFFGFSSEQIKLCRLPISSTGVKLLDRMLACESEEQMMELITGDLSPKEDGSGFIEIALARLRLRRAKKLLREQSLPVAYYAFLELCDIETENVIHVIEGIRYGLKPDNIERLVAC